MYDEVYVDVLHIREGDSVIFVDRFCLQSMCCVDVLIQIQKRLYTVKRYICYYAQLPHLRVNFRA